MQFPWDKQNYYMYNKNEVNDVFLPWQNFQVDSSKQRSHCVILLQCILPNQQNSLYLRNEKKKKFIGNKKIIIMFEHLNGL